MSFLLSAFGYEFSYFIMTVHIYDLSKSALNVDIFYYADINTTGNAVVLSLLNGAKLLGLLIGGLIIMTLSIKLLLYFTGVVHFSLPYVRFKVGTARAKGGPSFLANTTTESFLHMNHAAKSTCRDLEICRN